MAPDVTDVAAALPAVKTGFDLLGIVKDVKDVLPEGEKKETVAQAIAERAHHSV